MADVYSARCGDCLALDDFQWAEIEEPANERREPEYEVTPEDEWRQIERERLA